MKSLPIVCLAVLHGVSAVAADTSPANQESIVVTIIGTLHTGISAIGGETTGTTITARGITWELEFGRNVALHKAAASLNGQSVLVRGSLERKKGVEIRQRWIVTVTGLQAAGDGRAVAPEGPGLRAIVGRPDTRVRFVSDADKIVFDITSDLGIDQATIQRVGRKWPKSILVRLHLNGLESFKAGTYKQFVEWSIASTDGNASRVSMHRHGTDVRLDQTNPFYTKAILVGGNGTIPLKDGYFEVPLPAKMFEQNPRKIRLSWIDFYRN